jgi:N-methylhydantoinase A
VTARGMREKLRMPAVASKGKAAPTGSRKVCLERADRFVECAVYSRPALPAGAKIDGPALIEEYGSTTVMFEGDHATVSETGEIIVRVGGAK